MSTKQRHPAVRRSEQSRKWLIRLSKVKRVPHHTRNWWKAWCKRIEKELEDADGT